MGCFPALSCTEDNPTGQPANHDYRTDTVETTPTIIKKEALLITPAMVRLENDYTNLQKINPHDHNYTITSRAILTNFTV